MILACAFLFGSCDKQENLGRRVCKSGVDTSLVFSREVIFTNVGSCTDSIYDVRSYETYLTFNTYPYLERGSLPPPYEVKVIISFKCTGFAFDSEWFKGCLKPAIQREHYWWTEDNKIENAGSEAIPEIDILSIERKEEVKPFSSR